MKTDTAIKVAGSSVKREDPKSSSFLSCLRAGCWINPMIALVTIGAVLWVVQDLYHSGRSSRAQYFAQADEAEFIGGMRQELHESRRLIEEAEGRHNETRARSAVFLIIILGCSFIALRFVRRHESWKFIEASEARLRNELEAIAEELLVVDASLRIQQCNRAMEESWGKVRGEITGRPLLEVFPELTGTPLMTALREALDQRWITTLPRVEVPMPMGRRIYQARVIPFNGEAAVILADISSRDQAEEALRDAVLHYRTLFEQAGVGVSVVDASTGCFQRVNLRFCEITGRSSAELLATTFQAITHPDDVAQDVAQSAKLSAGGHESFQREKRYLRPDGSVVWVNLQVTALCPPGEKPVSNIAIVADITEGKLAEQLLLAQVNRTEAQRAAVTRMVLDEVVDSGDTKAALRRLMEEVSKALNVARVGVWRLSKDGKRLRCEELFEAGTNQHSEGAGIFLDTYPRYWQAIQSGSRVAADDALNDPATSEFAESYLKPLGISSILDAVIRLDGELAGMVCIEHTGPMRHWHADEEVFANTIANMVTQVFTHEASQEAHAERREMQEKFKTLINSVDGIIWEWNPESESFTYISRQCEKLLGFPQASWILQHGFWEQLVHPDDLEKAVAAHDEAMALVKPYSHDYRMIAADGRIVWMRESGVARCEHERVTAIHGLFLDITEQKKAAQELEFLNHQLVEASRTAGMAEVATGVLHNVGNVLNSVNVSANLIEDGIRSSTLPNLARAIALLHNQGDAGRFLADDPRGRMLPGYLKDGVELLRQEHSHILGEINLLSERIGHIKHIVSTQQNFARVSCMAESISAEELVEDALHINAAAFERHQVVVIRRFHPVPPITVDRHKVLQILINLLSNAKYAMDDTPLGERRIEVGVESREDGRVAISVRDHGMGIAPDDMARIFQHGFTTRAEGHGFGLHSGALAAREMGGNLSVHSNGPGSGATFTLELTASAVKHEQLREAA